MKKPWMWRLLLLSILLVQSSFLFATSFEERLEVTPKELVSHLLSSGVTPLSDTSSAGVWGSIQSVGETETLKKLVANGRDLPATAAQIVRQVANLHSGSESSSGIELMTSAGLYYTIHFVKDEEGKGSARLTNVLLTQQNAKESTWKSLTTQDCQMSRPVSWWRENDPNSSNHYSEVSYRKNGTFLTRNDSELLFPVFKATSTNGNSSSGFQCNTWLPIQTDKYATFVMIPIDDASPVTRILKSKWYDGETRRKPTKEELKEFYGSYPPPVRVPQNPYFQCPPDYSVMNGECINDDYYFSQGCPEGYRNRIVLYKGMNEKVCCLKNPSKGASLEKTCLMDSLASSTPSTPNTPTSSPDTPKTEHISPLPPTPTRNDSVTQNDPIHHPVTDEPSTSEATGSQDTQYSDRTIGTAQSSPTPHYNRLTVIEPQNAERPNTTSNVNNPVTSLFSDSHEEEGSSNRTTNPSSPSERSPASTTTSSSNTLCPPGSEVMMDLHELGYLPGGGNSSRKVRVKCDQNGKPIQPSFGASAQ